MVRSIGEDALSLIGAIGGGGSYRKGGDIPGSALNPPVVPTIVGTGWAAYVQTSSTLGQSWDPYQNEFLASWFNSNTQSVVVRANANDMKWIVTYFINSDNSGNNPSSKLSKPALYHAPTGKLYCNWYTYQNMTTPRYLRVFTPATQSSHIKELQIAIDFVLQRTADYVIFVDTYNRKIRKLTFADDSIVDIVDLSAYSSISVKYVQGWDKFIIDDGTNSRLYDYNGTFKAVIANRNIVTPCFYHAPSNSIICFKYTYGSSGGHFIEKYNPDTFTLISSTKLTALSNNSSSAYGQNCFYDPKGKAALVVVNINNIPTMYLLPFASDGSFNVPGWDPNNYNNMFADKVAGVKCGAYEAITDKGISAMVYVDSSVTDYYREFQYMKAAFQIA